MKKIIPFVLGMLTVLAFIPIVESVTECILTFLEPIKAVNTKKVMVLNNEIADLQAQLEPQSTSCIGFQYDEPCECCEDEEQDRKIGFIK